MTTSPTPPERAAPARVRPAAALPGRPVPRDLLITVLRAPGTMVDLDLRDWDVLIRAASAASVLSQIAIQAHERQLVHDLPAEVRPHLESARILAERHRVVVEWEVNRIEYALRHLDTPVILLKGAAYQALGLRTAAGRLTSDVDVLVPRDRISDVERALLAAGWSGEGLDSRDQEYFRRWLHELPPLRHVRRRTLIDVHHTILPPTDRLAVDPGLLLADSVPLPGRRTRVLAPADLFLHSAAHLFRNGRWAHAVRDLVDMDAMLALFSTEPRFWDTLLTRAERLDLRIPCAAALRTLQRYVGTPIPDVVAARSAGWQPRPPLGSLYDRLVDHALMPTGMDRPDPVCERARSVLALWPIPRLRAMSTALFWTKRLPRSGTRHNAANGEPLDDPLGAPGRPDDVARNQG